MKLKIKSLFILLISSITLLAGCAMDTSAPKIEKCTITYDINMEGQTAPEYKEVTIGTKLSSDNLLKAPENVDGYKFGGWCLDDAIVSKDYEVKTNITLKAKWLKYYTITYVLDTGKTQEAIYTIEDEVTLITPPNKEGYSFAGWYEKQDLTGNKVTKIVKGTTGNKTYYARWNLLVDLITHKVTFNNENNELIKTITICGDTAINSSEIPEPTKEHYDFTSWYNGSNPFDTSSVITSDIVLTAKYTPHNYTITYFDGDSELKTENYNIESTTKDLYTPSKDGYAFAGWYETKNFTGNKVTKIAKGTTGNKTYYANFIKFKTVDEAATYLQSLEQNGSTYDLYVQVNNDSDITKLRDELKKLDSKQIYINMYLKPGEGVTSVPEVGFYTACVLKKVELLNGFTTLEDDAFRECTSLEEIILPSSLTTISDRAVSFCEALKTVDLPKSITTIGPRNFDGNVTLNYQGTKQEFLNIKYNLNNNLPKIIQCSDGQLLEEQILDNSLNNVYIPDTVTDDYMRISVPFRCYNKKDFVIEYHCEDDIISYGDELLIKRLAPNTNTKKSVITLSLKNKKNITRSIEVTINHEPDVNKAVENLLTSKNINSGFGVRGGYEKLVLEDKNGNNYLIYIIFIKPQDKKIILEEEKESQYEDKSYEYNYTVDDDLKFTLTPIDNREPDIITNEDKFELYIKKDFVNTSSNSSIEIYKPNTPNNKTVYY